MNSNDSSPKKYQEFLQDYLPQLEIHDRRTKDTLSSLFAIQIPWWDEAHRSKISVHLWPFLNSLELGKADHSTISTDFLEFWNRYLKGKFVSSWSESYISRVTHDALLGLCHAYFDSYHNPQNNVESHKTLVWVRNSITPDEEEDHEIDFMFDELSDQKDKITSLRWDYMRFREVVDQKVVAELKMTWGNWDKMLETIFYGDKKLWRHPFMVSAQLPMLNNDQIESWIQTMKNYLIRNEKRFWLKTMSYREPWVSLWWIPLAKHYTRIDKFFTRDE